MKRKQHRLAILLISIPIAAALLSIGYLFSGALATDLGHGANERLLTPNWQIAQNELAQSQPSYEQKFAYYKLREGQDLSWVASHFSVDINRLRALNPGNVTFGTTIIVPPAASALIEEPVSQDLTGVTIKQVGGVTYVENRFTNPEVITDLPTLARLLQPWGVFEKRGPKEYLLRRPLYLQDNIRLQITPKTADALDLLSQPNFANVALIFQNSEALLSNATVTTLDPATARADTNSADGRSFLLAYENSRMDLINTHVSYLGMGLAQSKNPLYRSLKFVSVGGTYGVSWRIPTGTLGQNISTGWVQNSQFLHNYIGSSTFGASGMIWKSNTIADNEVYGLDSQDDSNNFVIQGNQFLRNGKYGLLLSKRCSNNQIRGNLAADNTLQGFMLLDSSNYNLLADNTASGNQDNFAISESNFDTLRGNRSLDPRGSHVRLDASAMQNYIQDNHFLGGGRGVYVKNHASGASITGNTFVHVKYELVAQSVQRIYFGQNQSDGVGYEVSGSRVVFGPNTITHLSTLQQLRHYLAFAMGR